jgi:hypothetical protein
VDGTGGKYDTATPFKDGKLVYISIKLPTRCSSAASTR